MGTQWDTTYIMGYRTKTWCCRKNWVIRWVYLSRSFRILHANDFRTPALLEGQTETTIWYDEECDGKPSPIFWGNVSKAILNHPFIVTLGDVSARTWAGKVELDEGGGWSEVFFCAGPMTELADSRSYICIYHMRKHTHIYIYTYIHILHTHMYIYIYICMYICIYTLKQLHNIIWWCTCNICLTIWGAIHLCSRSTPVPTWSPTLSRPGITQFLQEEPQGFTAALKRSLFDFQVCTGHQLRQKCGREKQFPTILPHVT